MYIHVYRRHHDIRQYNTDSTCEYNQSSLHPYLYLHWWTCYSEEARGERKTLLLPLHSTPTLTVTEILGGLYTCTVANEKPSSDLEQLNVLGNNVSMRSIINIPFFTVPPSPSEVNVSQNGLTSVLVSWTSKDPTATGYIIYYQQQDGEKRFSLTTATTFTITGLIVGSTYSISVASTSAALPSAATALHDVTIGTTYYYFEGYYHITR